MCESMRTTTIPSGNPCVEVYRYGTRRSTITLCNKVLLTIDNGLFSINPTTLGIDACTGTTPTADGEVCGGLSSTSCGGICEGLHSTVDGEDGNWHLLS